MRIFLIFLFCCSLGAQEFNKEFFEKERSLHWSYQDPVNSPVANDQNPWVQNKIDQYVIAFQKKHKLTPSEIASKETLIRRAYFSLVGLNPTYDQVESFLLDNSAQAYETLIDNLLASPRYGERWARHWLDVSRYADTRGYNFTSSSKFPFAYTYRDYVIRAFNDDKPYDQFIVEQLAADKIQLKNKQDLAALGFLTIGDRFINKIDEIVNDRIDVTTQAFLGMTVACARCHDHKVDPIPTADYYSLYGVFRSFTEPKMEDLPIIGESPNKAIYQKYLQKKTKLEKDLHHKQVEIYEKVRKEWPQAASGVIDYIGLQHVDKKGKYRDSKDKPQRRGLVNMLKKYIRSDVGKKDPFYSLLHHTNYAQNDKHVKMWVKDYSQRKETPKSLKEALLKALPQNRKGIYKVYSELALKVHASKDKNQYADIRGVLFGKTFQDLYNKVPHDAIVERDERNVLRKLKNKLVDHMATDGAPPRAMVINDSKKLYNPYIFIRGKGGDRGANVKRRFPQIISKNLNHEEFKNGSGRLELAQAIADKKNPLTARVMVNRVWQWHFGEGLVTTPSNFGKLGLPPTNPALLDHLAIWFMDNGWSLKKLHKYIMTSSTYMQASKIRSQMQANDGANKFLWRMNIHRLDWETLRDTLVQSTGTLKHISGGNAKDVMGFQKENYRSIYGYLDREKLPSALNSFDFPSASVTCEARVKTIVPQQGLYMMNSSLVTESAKSLSSQLDSMGNVNERIRFIFKKTFSRYPSEKELKRCVDFIDNNTEKFDYRRPTFEYGVAKMVDGQLKDFERFNHFSGARWQFGEKFPSKKHGHASLTEGGGHPGRTFPVVDRVTMFFDAEISLEGTLKHFSGNGDGVFASLCVNGQKVKSWNSSKSTVNTISGTVKVKAGDVIDIIVEPGKSDNSDGYKWAKVLTFTKDGFSQEHDFNAAFSSRQATGGGQFTVWDALVQVMFMSNEFLYVD
ncbi:MAG: DUF1549 and DUF1553 domain-containing protein [Lentisphaeraceae bacterium]|nr:DUF1549 and DUF1553 domain-containing protein [Lentisphaeraceae bacterium]